MNFSSMFYLLAQAKPTTEQVESGFAYAVAAFIVVWLFIAAYLFWLHRRQESLRQEVEMLRQEEADRQAASGSAWAGYETGRAETPVGGQSGQSRQELGG